MLRLLDIEFHKFKYSRSSKVLTIIYLVIVALTLFLGALPFSGGPIQDGRLADLGIFNFPVVWHISTYCISFLKLFIAIVIVSITASEYSNRTLKQNLIDGLSKKEFILSKLYFTVTLAAVATIIVFIASLILGLIYSDNDELSIIFYRMEYLPAFFLGHLIFFCLCLFAGVLFKRSAFALGFVMVLWLFEGVINLIVLYFDTKYDWAIADYTSHILPMNAMSNLLKLPFPKIEIVQQVFNLSNANLSFTYNVEWIDVLSVTIWSTLFIYWSYALIKKRDL